MDKQRILKEAQKIAAEFSFWMVSGDISHLFGYVYETSEGKYELEIKFSEEFPNAPPNLIYHKEIKELLGDFHLETLHIWSADSSVVKIVHELRKMILNALDISETHEEQSDIPISLENDNAMNMKDEFSQGDSDEDNLAIGLGKEEVELKELKSKEEEYITPDLSAYPPDFEYEQFVPSSLTEDNYVQHDLLEETSLKPVIRENENSTKQETSEMTPAELYADHEDTSVALNTEIGLIQQEYAYDQKSHQKGDLVIYLTITVTKTFIININFTEYPDRPSLQVTEEIHSLVGDVYQTLEVLRSWNPKKPPHIVDILHELENKLFFIKDIEQESKKILGEYECDLDSDNASKLKVHLVTYGFKDYSLDVNLESYPKPPMINLSSQLEQLINTQLTELDSYNNWIEGESEPVDIIRELAWLVDKNSRINFEIELLKEHYKEIDYNSEQSTLNMNMKGKMKSQDLTFKFQIDLPRDYPMKVPTIKITNEFELESHEKIKTDLQSSFKNFFDEWSPFSYLIDLFNTISKNIFEVSVVSCVICHKIDCPTCSLKIAGSDRETCHTDCPYCERSYHLHCWQQTIRSFGKCGFCLKTPPSDMIPV